MIFLGPFSVCLIVTLLLAENLQVFRPFIVKPVIGEVVDLENAPGTAPLTPMACAMECEETNLFPFRRFVILFLRPEDFLSLLPGYSLGSSRGLGAVVP